MSEGGSGPTLSAVVTVRNEEGQLADCLERLRFADEIVVVLDRCTDGSKAIAARFTDRLVEGAWELEGPRRNAGIDAAAGDWILEVDADERVNEGLAREIRATIAGAEPGHFLIPFDNYIGARLVRHGWGASWGVRAAARLFSRGAKRWSEQRVHPAIKLEGRERRLDTPIEHYFEGGLGGMLARLDRYTELRAADLRERGARLPPFIWTVRRGFSRFFKCYVSRKGYREGLWGFTIALMAALYPLLSHLKAELDPPPKR